MDTIHRLESYGEFASDQCPCNVPRGQPNGINSVVDALGAPTKEVPISCVLCVLRSNRIWNDEKRKGNGRNGRMIAHNGEGERGGGLIHSLSPPNQSTQWRVIGIVEGDGGDLIGILEVCCIRAKDA